MIASFKSRTLEKFWWKGEPRKVQPGHIAKLTMLLTALDAATSPEDLNRPSFAFHALKGKMLGRYAVRVDKNWRITFGFESENAVNVNLEDYH